MIDPWVWPAVILFVVIVILAFEFYALKHGKPTLSRVLWETAKSWPVLPFAIGILCGHFFWQLACVCPELPAQ